MSTGGSSRGGGKVSEKRAHDNAALPSPPRPPPHYYLLLLFPPFLSSSSPFSLCRRRYRRRRHHLRLLLLSPFPPPLLPPLASPGGGCRELIKNSVDDELLEDVGLPSLFSLFRSRSTSPSAPGSFTHTYTLSHSPCTPPLIFRSLAFNFLAPFVAFLPSLRRPRDRTDPFHSFFVAPPRGAAARSPHRQVALFIATRVCWGKRRVNYQIVTGVPDRCGKLAL